MLVVVNSGREAGPRARKTADFDTAFPDLISTATQPHHTPISVPPRLL